MPRIFFLGFLAGHQAPEEVEEEEQLAPMVMNAAMVMNTCTGCSAVRYVGALSNRNSAADARPGPENASA